MTRRSSVLVLWGLLLALSACASLDPAKDVELTWDRAYVRIPGALPLAPAHRHLLPSYLPPGTRYPTVIYMHGAGGLSRSAYGDIDVALEAGVAVIALDSYARERPGNPGVDLSYTCPDGTCWTIDRQILAFRTAELAYALERLKQVPWVDQDNVFGWGQSEGVYAIGTYPGAVFKGRIITGNGCAWGFRAEEPALAVISRRDPYVARHRLEFTRPSNCLEISGRAGNLTYVEIPGAVHNAAQTEAGERTVQQFLRRHVTPSE